MQIREINLEAFGNLTNFSVVPEPGVNLWIGENESGKSTLRHSIEVLLFGLGKQPGAHSYLPRSGVPVRLAMQGCLQSGDPFSIQRSLRQSMYVVHDREIALEQESLPQASHLTPLLYRQLYALSTEESSVFRALSFEEVERRLLENFGVGEIKTSESVLEYLKQTGNALYRYNGRGNMQVKAAAQAARDSRKAFESSLVVLEAYRSQRHQAEKLTEQVAELEREIARLERLSELTSLCLSALPHAEFLLKNHETDFSEADTELVLCDNLLSRLRMYTQDRQEILRCIAVFEKNVGILGGSWKPGIPHTLLGACSVEGLSPPEDQRTDILEEAQQEIFHLIALYREWYADIQKPFRPWMLYPVLALLGIVYVLVDRPAVDFSMILTGLAVGAGALYFTLVGRRHARTLEEQDVIQTHALGLYPIKQPEEVFSRHRISGMLQERIVQLEGLRESLAAWQAQLLFATHTQADLIQMSRASQLYALIRGLDLMHWQGILEAHVSTIRGQQRVVQQSLQQRPTHQKALEELELQMGMPFEKAVSTVLAEAHIHWREKSQWMPMLLEKSGDLKQALAEARTAYYRDAPALQSLNQALSELPSSVHLEAKAEQAEKKLAEMMRERDRLSILRAFIEQQDKRFRATRQPEVLQRAGDYLTQLTLGTYTRIALSTDPEGRSGKTEFLVFNGDMWQRVEGLTGTGLCEQIFVAVKLALVDVVEKGREPLPWIVDEPFAHWDDRRSMAWSKILIDLGKKRQIFVLSCTKRTAEIFMQASGGSGFNVLNPGINKMSL